MPSRKPPATDPAKLDRLVADARRGREQRGHGYREQALKLFPHFCARCGRAFEGAALKELTVHHKDHDHDRNPSDGSNWELLCTFCHDDEHQRQLAREEALGGDRDAPATHRPFAGLDALLKK